MKHGYFRQYYTNGRLQSEILYNQDKVVLSRRYDEYGTLIEGVDPVNGEDDLIPDLSGKKKRKLAEKDKKKQDKIKRKEQKKNQPTEKTD
jgi:antitoxin component YwqK of YwqJK toxin-antitoxin module